MKPINTRKLATYRLKLQMVDLSWLKVYIEFDKENGDFMDYVGQEEYYKALSLKKEKCL